MRSRRGRLVALLALPLLATGCGPLFWRTPSEQAVTRAAALEMYWKDKARPTLWQVDDRASAFLMDRFYRALAGGAGKGAALRHAQLATMRAFPPAYFWAGYQLTGEPGAPVRGAATGSAPRCG